MTARPWGTTGRVTLVREPVTGYYNDVLVDGVKVGVADNPSDASGAPLGWRAGAWGHQIVRAPSLDAAVMWVLRRAATDVWRQERGPFSTVWRSRSMNPGKWVTEWRGDGPTRVLVSDTHAEALAAALGPTP